MLSVSHSRSGPSTAGQRLATAILALFLLTANPVCSASPHKGPDLASISFMARAHHLSNRHAFVKEHHQHGHASRKRRPHQRDAIVEAPNARPEQSGVAAAITKQVSRERRREKRAVEAVAALRIREDELGGDAADDPTPAWTLAQPVNEAVVPADDVPEEQAAWEMQDEDFDDEDEAEDSEDWWDLSARLR